MSMTAAPLLRITKIVILLVAARFLYWFIRDSYEELMINPVHFFEDAYMFIRYAKIWHLGFGESWNIGAGPVYGNTSQLHFLLVLLLTGFHSLADDMVIKLSSYIPAFMFISWLPYFCARHSPLFSSQPTYQRYILWLGIICPFIYWQTPYAYHYLTGMDTSLSILMHLLLIDAVLTYARSKSPVAFGLVILLTYLAYATRPENLLATAVFSVLYLGLVAKDTVAVKKYTIVLSLILLVDGLCKYVYFGDFFPLAFYSKQSGYMQGNAGAAYSHPVFYFFYFLSTILPFVVVQFFTLRKENMVRQAIIIGPAILTLGYFFTMMTVMNMKGRYFYPFTPYFIAAAIVTFHRDSINVKQYSRNGILLFIALVLFVVVTLCEQRSGGIATYLTGEQQLCDDALKSPAADFAGEGYRVDTDGFAHVVNLLKDAPPGTRVAMTEHGFIGSQLPHTYIIDMTGLHDPYVARHGLSGQWLLAQAPDLIWMPHWHYTCMTHEILYNETFRQHFEFYPGLFTWGVALRKDSSHYELLKTSLQKQVESLYPGYQLNDFEKQLPD